METTLRTEAGTIIAITFTIHINAINDIDASALESLEAIDRRLRDAGLRLHLSEVKGPVMDRLPRTDFLQHLSGKVYLSQFQAVMELAPEIVGQSNRPIEGVSG